MFTKIINSKTLEENLDFDHKSPTPFLQGALQLLPTYGQGNYIISQVSGKWQHKSDWLIHGVECCADGSAAGCEESAC